MNVPPDNPLKLQGALLVGHVEQLCSLLVPSLAGFLSMSGHVLIWRHWHSRDTP